jgi:hypothetical protein
VRILAVAIAVLLAACSGDLGPPRPQSLPTPDDRPPLLTAGARSPRIASYRLDAALDAAEHRVTGTAHVTWKNDGVTPVSALPFHLYMNAFKNDDSVFMQESHGSMRGVAFSDQHWGWIDVTSITSSGQELRGEAKMTPPEGSPGDETILEVPLPHPVLPGESVELDLAFTTQLPEVFARTGWKGAFLMIAQWFPKVCVRIGEVWHREPFHANSEFFADFGTYDVTLTVPSTHVVAATGVLTASTDNGDGTVTLTYRAEDVHDFAWMADPYMKTMSGTATVATGEVEVRVYYRPDQQDFARRHLAAGIGAIETFSDMLVPYPWPIMSIIDPPLDAGGAAGMEYPMLVTTAGDGWYARDGVRLPEYVTIHEVGHNWFQGMLASDEVAEAWMDEGVNEYADGLVMGRLYGERGSAVDWLDFSMDIDRLRRAVLAPLASIPSPIATASWAFVDNEAYGAATYMRTAMALKTLENVVGRDRFLAALKTYAGTWAFRHPTGRDFFAAISASVGQDLSWFWGPAFEGTGTAEYTVRTAGCRPKHEARGVFGSGDDRRIVLDDQATGTFECEVVIVDEGTVAVPVDIEVHFADGSIEPYVWDHKDGKSWYRIPIDRSSELVEVEIDPDRKILLADNQLDDHLRLTPSSRASLRAAARVTFWAQTMMQGLAL